MLLCLEDFDNASSCNHELEATSLKTIFNDLLTDLFIH